jgi:excisionase family DNA binding protein
MHDPDPTVEGSRRVALGVEESARALGISRAFLYRLLRDGTGPKSFVAGGRRLFAVSELQDWADRATKAGRVAA